MPESNPASWVAVIDDDQSMRRSLVRLLRTHGIHARAFASGEEYWNSVGEPAPIGILLDVHLRPGMSGFELSAMLSARHDAPPVVFITGADESDLALPTERHRSAGMLRKPFDARKLIDLVTQCFGLETVQSR